MKRQQYQLVLQFPCRSPLEFDAVVSLEDSLISAFSESDVEIDGHDFGSGEANIFIFTAEPNQTFERVQSIVSRNANLAIVLRAAYRSTDTEEYSVLWPPGETEFAVA